MAGLIETLRSGSWLTRERARIVAFAVVAASLLGIAWLVATADGLMDRFGHPLGTDFVSFYAAGTLVQDGLPAAPYDIAAHFIRERELFGPATPYYSFLYPPFFLLVAALLALLPYVFSLALWQGVTLALYLSAIRAISAPRLDKLWLLLAIAFPAAIINLGHGQNGFLTAALFGGALALLERKPAVAGVLLGLLAYKPQFGLLVPLALAAAGYWRAIIAASLTMIALAIVTTAAFGMPVWDAFLHSTPFTRDILLEQGEVGWFKMQSVFAWARMWGAPVGLAYIAQACVALAVAATIVAGWSSSARYATKAAVLLLGTLLATPFSLDYDLMLLAPAITFLAADGMQRGFAPYEKTMLAALWVVPLLARSVPQLTDVPLAAPLILAAFVVISRSAFPAASVQAIRSR
jgi:hypothetical protein